MTQQEVTKMIQKRKRGKSEWLCGFMDVLQQELLSGSEKANEDYANMLKMYPELEKVNSKATPPILSFEDARYLLGDSARDYFRLAHYNKDKPACEQDINSLKARHMDIVLNESGGRAFCEDKELMKKTWAQANEIPYLILAKTSEIEFCETFKGEEQLFVKPAKRIDNSTTYCIKITKSLKKIYKELKKERRDLIVEAPIKQDVWFEKLNPSSVNTIRVITLRKENKVVVLDASLHVGAKGHNTDSLDNGGGVFPVVLLKGEIQRGYDVLGNDVCSVPGKENIVGDLIPGWKSFYDTAIALQTEAPQGLNFVGWDLCTNNGKVILVNAHTCPEFAPVRLANHNTWGRIKRLMKNELYQGETDKFILDSIERVEENKKKIIYHYRIIGPWNSFFKNEIYSIEYSKNIDEVPDSILALPLFANLLPVAWYFNAQVIFPALDKDFYYAIPDIKKGYDRMHPELDMKADIVIGNIEENVPAEEPNQSLAFFSGGVDALTTMIRHVDEKPYLFMMFGVDNEYNNVEGTTHMKDLLTETVRDFDLKEEYCYSSFRTVFRKYLLNSLCKVKGQTWWHDYQHGIGLLAHAAPMAWVNHVSDVYLASTYTADDDIVCASDPTIDNYVRYCGAQAHHDGYELDRFMKIQTISNFAKERNKKIFIRSCYHSNVGDNCCDCEKCFRTILNIYALGDDPKDFGFTNYDSFDELCKHIEKVKKRIRKRFRENYYPIYKNLRINYTQDQIPEGLLWFYNFDFEQSDEEIAKYFTRKKKCF